MCNSGGGNIPKETKQTYTHELSKEAKPYWQYGARRAKSLAGEQWQPYQGQRVAGFAPQERQAFQGVQSLYDAGPREELGFGYGQTQQAGETAADSGQWGSSAYQQYVNPFQENVAALGRERIMDEYRRAVPGARMGASTAASRAGVMGGRQNLMGARASREMSDVAFKNLREYQAGQEQYGYESALAAWQADQDRRQKGAEIQLSASAEARALADAQQSQAIQRLAAMQEAGMSQRDMNQAMKDIAYQDWDEERNWDRELVNWYTGILAGSPYSTTDTTQTTNYGYQGSPSNTLSQIAGLGAAGIGAYGMYRGA